MTTADNQLSQAPSRNSMQGGKKKVAKAAGTTARWTFLLAAIALILLAILLILARVGLPWFSNYKEHIEARLSAQLNTPVVISELAVRWEQFGPKLSASNVSISDSENRHITLDEVLIDLNVIDSISQRMPVIEELTLVGAKLSLESSADGSFEIHGVERPSVSSNQTGQSADVLSWLMTTNRVGMRDATITVINADNDKSYAITDLNVVAINENDMHQLRLDMQLPEALGGAVEVGFDLVGQSDDIRRASADVHIKADSLKADAWRMLQSSRFEDLPMSTTGIARLDADVQLELWGGIEKGRLDTARGQLKITDVVDVQSQQPVLESIATDVVFESTDIGWQLVADSLALNEGGVSTVVKDVVYEFKPDINTAWKLDANGESLKLDLATKLVLSLFDKAADLPRARWLADASPRGKLSDWTASFALVAGKPDLTLQSQFSELRLSAAGGLPGADRVNGTIDLRHNIGQITMQGVDIALDFPNAFDQPLQLEKLSSQFDLDVQDPLRTALQGEILIEDKGFNVTTRLGVKLDPATSPHIDMQGKFSLADLGQAKHYVPVRLLRPPITRWLNQALLAGEAVNGELLMFGHVADFPFSENDGVFKVGFDINKANLKYLNSWPEATQLKGRFDMNGAAIRTIATDGRVDAMRLSQLTARIDDVRNPVLDLATTSAGSAAELLAFANNGPLSRILKPALNSVDATGRAQMDMSLTVPLKRTQTSASVADAQEKVKKASKRISGLKVNGSIFLNNSDINVGVAKLALAEVNGAIGFTHQGVRVNKLQGLLNGRAVRIDSETSGKGQNRVTEIVLDGPIRAEKMLDNYGIPLIRFAEGESQWNVNVQVPMNAKALANNGIKIAAVSDLVGTRLLFPKPLGKSVSSSSRLTLTSTLFPKSDTREWLVDYSDSMKAVVRVREGRLQSMTAKLGSETPKAIVNQGIRMEGDVAELELDGWVQSIAGLIDELPSSDTPSKIMPISGKIRAKQFIAGKQKVGGGVLEFNSDDNYLNGFIESPWLIANVRYPREHWTQKTAAISRISFLDKRFIDALGTADSPTQGGELDPRLLPPLDIRLAQIRWDIVDLRELVIRTSPSVSGLNIDTFGMADESMQLIGSGYWRLRDPQGVNDNLKNQHVTKLDLTVQSSDFGQAVTNIGFGGTLHEGEGVLSGSLVWPAPAYKPSLENLGGKMNIDIAKGRILKVEPGAAKIVGLFALSSIPRRLSLDFKDLVLDGLDYETIRGDAQLANGIAYAPLIQLNGSVGVVDITGESNLLNREYNQRITVLPRVSAALPIIGIISGGATAGIGALFAGGLLKAVGLDFDRIGLREYTLTGKWDMPELKAVPYEVVELK